MVIPLSPVDSRTLLPADTLLFWSAVRPGGEGPHPVWPVAAAGSRFTFSAMPRPQRMGSLGTSLRFPCDLSPSRRSPGCPGPAVPRVPLLPLHPRAPWSTLGGGQGLSRLEASRPTHSLASLEPEVFAQALCVCRPLTTGSPFPLGLRAPLCRKGLQEPPLRPIFLLSPAGCTHCPFFGHSP